MGDFLLPQTAQPGDRDATRRLSAPIHSERHVRVICVGAGASGLLMAYKLQKHFHNYSLVCYEKNKAVSSRVSGGNQVTPLKCGATEHTAWQCNVGRPRPRQGVLRTRDRLR